MSPISATRTAFPLWCWVLFILGLSVGC